MENSIRYDVIFAGELAQGLTVQEARERITASGLMTNQKAADIKFDGSPFVLYSSASRSLAHSARRKFEESGLQCGLIESAETPVSAGYGILTDPVNLAIISAVVFLTILAFTYLASN